MKLVYKVEGEEWKLSLLCSSQYICRHEITLYLKRLFFVFFFLSFSTGREALIKKHLFFYPNRINYRLTSVEPENKRFILRGSGGFSEPVEEWSAMLLVHSDITGELRECHTWLPRERQDSILLLLFWHSNSKINGWKCND